ncbi:MAG: hypothetical protein GF344_19770 [Chitinivibrionales bacterium]|nr:hypothetical protein [Chitinivibrionales bacterium]MBD3358853.1 hypothetical protein [Chitinivibrionales bacterium]
MHRLISLIAMMACSGIYFGCTCDCEVCAETKDLKNCDIVNDVRKADCSVEQYCIEENREVTCSAECK